MRINSDGWSDESQLWISVKIKRNQKVTVHLAQNFSRGTINWVWAEIRQNPGTFVYLQVKLRYELEKQTMVDIVPLGLTEESLEKLKSDLEDKGQICLVLNPAYYDLEKMPQIPNFFWDTDEFFRVRVTFNTHTKQSWRVLEMKEMDE